MSSIKPGAILFLSPDGRDDNPGSADKPFATLERARDEVRAMKQRGPLPEGGVMIAVRGGAYLVHQSFTLTDADSGTPTAPIVYRADGTAAPRFTGGVRLGAFTPITDEAVLARLPESARGHVLEADLAATGVAAPIPFELGGFASGRGANTHSAMELFVGGEPMTWARWPNEGFVETGEITGPNTLQSWDKKPGSPEGRFRFDDERVARWAAEPNAWLYGYWFWNWADSYEKIDHIDPATREIVLAKPWHTYGYKQGHRFFAVNMLCELDAPGECYLDGVRKKVYLFPKKDLPNATVELSAAPFPLAVIDGASHVRFQGLTWECGAADGVVVRKGEDVHLEGCTVRKMAGDGVVVQGGHAHVIQSCDIHTMGRGGVAMSGGDRKTLARAEHLVENCHIHHLSRIDHTYTPGVWLDGAGIRIRHNLIHDIASSAMRIEGNDCLIEFNEAYRVVLESDDQGAVDMFGNPTFRGNVYQYNYWHHLGAPGQQGDTTSPQRAGIRLDDAICGVTIKGNIFQRCCSTPTHFGGVQIHGGKDNLVDGNLFVDCGAAVSFSPWGEERWQKFVGAALDAPAIDKALYIERYPALAHLTEAHDTNAIKNNVIVRCDQTFLRAPASVTATDNHEYPQGTEFAEGPDGRIVWSAGDAKRLGLADIPFDQIGPYADTWRTRDGNGWNLAHP